MVGSQRDLRDSVVGGRKRNPQSQGLCLDAERSRVLLPFMVNRDKIPYISMKPTWENRPPCGLVSGRWCFGKRLVVLKVDCNITRGFCEISFQRVEHDLDI